jgi:hypothetical protein
MSQNITSSKSRILLTTDTALSLTISGNIETLGIVRGILDRSYVQEPHTLAKGDVTIEDKCRSAFSTANAVVALRPTGETLFGASMYIGTAVHVKGVKLG